MSRPGGKGGSGDGAPRRERWPAEYDRTLWPVLPRVEFLKAIERRAPEVLEALARDVRPEFELALARLARRPEDVLRSGRGSDDGTLHVQLAGSLGRAINRWATAFRILDSGRNRLNGLPGDPESFVWWLIPVAVDTLAAWSQGSDPGHRGWHLSRVEGPEHAPGESPAIELHLPGWLPTAESKLAFIERVHALFREALGDHLHQAEWGIHPPPITELPPELDWLPAEDREDLLRLLPQAPPPFQKVAGGYTPEHFDWFVDYQVRGQTYAAIARADAAGRGYRAVTAGVKQAAERVFGPFYGRWLRESPRGRPRSG